MCCNIVMEGMRQDWYAAQEIDVRYVAGVKATAALTLSS